MSARPLASRAFVVALTLLLVLAVPRRASAEPAGGDARKEAQTLFEQAVKLARDGNSAAALASFQAAYERYPSFRVLYNIGQLCARTGDGACAVRAYDQYLRDGGADVPAKRRESIEADIQALSRSLARLRLRSNASGDEVKIDEVSVGRMPIVQAVPVNPGSHAVVMVHEGHVIAQTVQVAAGETASVQLDVAEEAAPPSAAPPVRDAAPAPQVRREGSFPVVPWVITGALLAATAVSGVLAAGAYGTYTDKRDAFPITRGELDDAQGSARDLFVLTSVLGAATVISAGISGYLTLWPRRPDGPALGPRVGLAAGPGVVSIVGVLP